MAKKRLGIDALFQTSVPRPEPEPRVDGSTEVAVDRIAPRSRQPRAHFDAAALRELTESVRTHGVLQPILVRAAATPGRFEIVAGERRWRAAKAAGLEQVPVHVLAIEDADAFGVAMIENLQREDLNPLDEAEGYIELLRIRLETEPAFGPLAAGEARTGVLRVLRALNNRAAGNTKDNVVLSLEPAVREVFDRVGRITWQTFVAHRLPLLGLPDDVRSAIRVAGLEYTKARLIARVTAERLAVDENHARRIRRDLAEQAATEGLSVRGLNDEIKRVLGRESAQAPKQNATRGRGAVGDAVAKIERLRERLDRLDMTAAKPARRAEIDAAIETLLTLLERS
jgi:ParB family chromosome partitioning protein